MKVKILDKRVFRDFLGKVSVISAFFTITFIFIDIPRQYKFGAGLIVALFFLFLYLLLWWRYNILKKVTLTIEGSKVEVKSGDIFEQPGFKAIAFNEHFDTLVDDKVISKKSLNGVFIDYYLDRSANELDYYIEKYQFDDDEVLEPKADREGKTKRYKLGTVCVLGDYLLVAFSKFDKKNRANLEMPEYLEFLINFWDNVNRVYSQSDVSVPVFGSGITRIKEHKSISDESLLEIMLWTFRISEMRFKYPAKLHIIIHKDKMKSINLLDIKSSQNGT